MKNLVFTFGLVLTAMMSAKAQVSKADFDKQIKFFKAELDQHSTNTTPLYGTRKRIVDLMNQQIDYTTKQHKDKDLNMKCTQEKQFKSKDMTACYQLEAIQNTLTKEKNCLDAVNNVADKDIYGNKDMLLQQMNKFDEMLQ